MDPGFRTDFVSLFGDFFKDLRIMLLRDTVRKKARLNFFALEHLQHSVDPDPFTELAIRNDRKIAFRHRVSWKTASILLLQCVGAAEILWPSFEGDARRDRDT